jgi:hypothetical protein
MPKFTPDRRRVTLSFRNDKVSREDAGSSRKNALFCLFISLGSRVSLGRDVGIAPTLQMAWFSQRASSRAA